MPILITAGNGSEFFGFNQGITIKQWKKVSPCGLDSDVWFRFDVAFGGFLAFCSVFSTCTMETVNADERSYEEKIAEVSPPERSRTFSDSENPENPDRIPTNSGREFVRENVCRSGFVREFCGRSVGKSRIRINPDQEWNLCYSACGTATAIIVENPSNGSHTARLWCFCCVRRRWWTKLIIDFIGFSVGK